MSEDDSSVGKQLCAAEGDNCNKCTRSECNSEKIETGGQCYICDETNGEKCTDVADLTSEYCPLGENLGCFHSQIGEIILIS